MILQKPKQLRARMIEVVVNNCPHCQSVENCDLSHESDIDALLTAGATEGWVMPWMYEFTSSGMHVTGYRILPSDAGS